jgi:DNA mismatch endonuclease (patch repair protein)
VVPRTSVSTGSPTASSPEVSARMSRTRGRDTVPERALRSAAHALGLRFRVDRAPVATSGRRADMVFVSSRVAVFLDGCFWHGCPEHATWPKANAEFWRSKIEANRQRDRDTDRHLTENGWVVVRVWEHEDPVVAAHRIAALINARPRRTRRRSYDSSSRPAA